MLQALSQKVTRRTIQIVLGSLWLLDGILQLQHQMFTANFANDIIAPAAQGQPTFVASVMHFFIRVFLLHPAICNSLIALIQMSLGVLILWKRTARLGLMLSVGWGLFVWYVGEGLGGIASGQTSLLMGAPGAALLYSVIALGVMASKTVKNKQSSGSPADWLGFVWVVVWLGGAVLQLMAGQNTTAELSTMISGMAQGAPGWLASLDLHTSSLLHGSGGWVIGLLVIVQALIGILVLLPHRSVRTLAISLGILLSLVFWVIGQSLGAYYTGLATDPNTGPLLILLGIAVFGSRQVDLTIL
jgi:hypothetical protein